MTVSSLPITSLLDHNARTRPDALAVSFPGEQLSFAQLDLATRRAARVLRSMGIAPGDRVGIFLPGASADYLVLALAAIRLGAVAACINARFKTRELGFALRNAECPVVFTVARFRDLFDTELYDGTVIDVAAARSQWAGPAAVPPLDESVATDPDRPARIIYTSGTTSMPKACVHTAAAMAHQGSAVAERLHLEPDDRFWTPLPLFHTGGWTPFLAAQAAGASLHHNGHFEPTTAVRQIIDERCTVLFPGFETIWMQVLTHAEFAPERLSSARLVINVGTPERLRIMQELLPQVAQVSNTGCTEVGGFLALGEAADPPESRFTTAGRVLPGMEVRLIDPLSGGQVPDGTPGELQVRGPGCLSGYHGDPESTAAAFVDGWFRTGDLVSRSDSGELRYISRLKDMLKVGGENVAAVEIEDHLLSHPAVRMVAVVAAPDDVYGEVPAAYLELWPGARVTEAEIIEFCRGAIASFKVPRHVRFLSEWPMSGTKVRKVELRRLVADELGQRSVGDSAAPQVDSTPT
ncbi:MAG: class I adenylate-forming enzyme family protein [Nocardioides sp.]|nr:class I adenylate-forming enzyme family protein [Nocardioides sp.]MDI6909222.1 class I adenylate-forming enzyme family protein [Nocardioides sp.]